MKSPLADSERDRLIAAMLPDVAFDGWSRHALRLAAGRIGMPVAEAMALFPRGAPDMVAAFSRWADRQMLDRLEALPAESVSLSRRITLALRLRFELLLPWREAVRRGMAVLAMPQNAALGLRLLYETVDGTWYAVGDTATDFSFYTKRASLAAIYAAAMLFWLAGRRRDRRVRRAPIGGSAPHDRAPPAPRGGRRAIAEPAAPAAPDSLGQELLDSLSALKGGEGDLVAA
jgi:rpsU-divergently transcribed protein